MMLQLWTIIKQKFVSWALLLYPLFTFLRDLRGSMKNNNQGLILCHWTFSATSQTWAILRSRVSWVSLWILLKCSIDYITKLTEDAFYNMHKSCLLLSSVPQGCLLFFIWAPFQFLECLAYINIMLDEHHSNL